MYRIYYYNNILLYRLSVSSCSFEIQEGLHVERLLANHFVQQFACLHSRLHCATAQAVTDHKQDLQVFGWKERETKCCSV